MTITPRRVACLALVAGGFGAGVAQVLLLRELLTVAYGNELSMGILLACWLVWGAGGALLARRAREGEGPYGGSARLMIVLACLPGPALVAGLLLARAGLLIFSSLPELCPAGGHSCPIISLVAGALGLRPGEALSPGHMALLGLLAAAGPAALDGAQFAVGCRLYARTGTSAESLGVAYALDAIGHLLGGVVLAWAVVLALNPLASALVAGGINLAAALALALVALPGALRPLRTLAAGVAVTAALALFAPGLNRASLAWRVPGQELLASVESIYGNLTITRQDPDGIYLYQSGVYSGASPPLVGTIDVFIHFAMLQHPAPERVLMIGGGVLGGLAEVLKYDPVLVHYIELDGKLFDLARKWADEGDVAALDDPRVEAVQGDGRRVVAGAAGGRWDVILVCLPDPSTAQLNRFYTAGFYRQARAALADGGVVAWEIPGADAYFSPALLRLHTCLLGTAQRELPALMRMPGEKTAYVAGRPDYLTEDWQELERRMSERGVQSDYFAALLPDLLNPWTLDSVQETLQAAPPAPVNRDLRAIGYYLDQAWWMTQFHPGWAQLLAWVEGLTVGRLLLPALALALLLLALSPLRGVRGAFVPLSVAVTGLLAMGIELALLLSFQALYGYVYHMVGVIVGAFMVGLAAGSVATSSWLHGRSRWPVRAAMVATQLALAAVAMGIAAGLPALWSDAGPWLQSGWGAVLVFPLLTALVGLMVGVQFPLATAAWYDTGESPRAAAGLYAADLLGASAGAL
ncbi:MAG TPA: hypothetical protein VM283_05340, partial [Armatimonadota bacterium]|nr:hypothetical protein [Armatimonadota bacterium]